MINEFEIYHGIAFSRILHGAKAEVSFSSYRDDDNSTYILNGKVGLYIKYSTKRLSPWRFSFTKDQQENFIELREKFKNAFLALVCQKDGVVLLSFDEVRQILDEKIDAVEWISVSRGKGKMYSVKGSDGELEFKIGKNMFPEKLFEFF
jgi:hypothetical protein